VLSDRTEFDVNVYEYMGTGRRVNMSITCHHPNSDTRLARSTSSLRRGAQLWIVGEVRKIDTDLYMRIRDITFWGKPPTQNAPAILPWDDHDTDTPEGKGKQKEKENEDPIATMHNSRKTQVKPANALQTRGSKRTRNPKANQTYTPPEKIIKLATEALEAAATNTDTTPGAKPDGTEESTETKDPQEESSKAASRRKK